MTGAARLAAALALALAAALTSLVPGATPAAAQSSGDFNLLDVLNKLSSQTVQQSMAQFPVPFAVLTRASASTACPVTGGVVEQVVVYKAGSTKKIDVDNCLATGRGGSDIEILVEQVLPTGTTPFQIRLTINRIDSSGGPTALEQQRDLAIIVAFPMDPFNDETLHAPPYLFWGYTTRDNNAATCGAGCTKIIPQTEQLLFAPNIFGGTSHTFGMTLNAGGSLPTSLKILGGLYQNEMALNPPPPGATIFDLNTSSLRLTPQPASATLTLSATENFLPSPSLSKITATWSASALTKAVLTYDETVGQSTNPSAPHYTDTITFDQLPKNEALTVALNLGASPPTFKVQHAADSIINTLTVGRTQTNGSASQTFTFTSIPKTVDLTLKKDALTFAVGPADGTVNSPVLGSATMDFVDNNGLLGATSPKLTHAQAQLVAVPDFGINWVAGSAVPNSVTGGVTNPADFIGFVGVAMATGTKYPDLWTTAAATHAPQRDHVLAFEDDADGFRFAAGLGKLKTVSWNLDASAPATDFVMELGGANHAQLRLLVDKATATVLPHTKDLDIRCQIHDLPQSMTLYGTNFIDQWHYKASADIEALSCSGKIGTKQFDLQMGGLPSGVDANVDFKAEGHFNLTLPTGKQLGLFQLLCYDPFGLDGSDVFFGGGTEFKQAKGKFTSVPSVASNWSYGSAAFAANFNTPNPGTFLGSAEAAGSTLDPGSLGTYATRLLPPPVVGASDDYARIKDQGTSGAEKAFGLGIVGLDSASFSMNNAGAVDFNYASNATHLLHGFWDTDITSTLTGPNLGIAADVHVDSIPATFHVTTNLSTQLTLTASAGLNKITAVADIKQKSGSDVRTTHADVLLDGLPSSVGYTLVPDAEGSADLTMSNPITEVKVELTGNDGVLLQPYKHILADIKNIPANWSAHWGTSPEPHADLSTSSALGPVSLIISRDVKANTPSKYNPFTVAGGSVQYTPFAREIDRRYFRQGQGDDDVREATLMPRLDGLYGTTTKLNSGEDHVIYRKNGSGQLDFLSVQATGFKCASVRVGAGFQCDGVAGVAGEITATVSIPSPGGSHPFYVAVEDPAGKFLTVDVPNVPQTTRAVVGSTRANLDFNASPGKIVIYKGPLPAASDGQDALKVIINNTPSFAHVDWNLGFPGHINFDLPSAVEVAVLSQDSGNRTVADFQVGDLNASWGYDLLDNEFDCSLTEGCGEFLVIAKVFFNFVANPAIDGFIASYNRIGDPVNLDPAGPAHASSEYVPRVTIYVDDFSHFAAEAKIRVCVAGICTIGIVQPSIDISTDLLGAFNFDFWDLGGVFPLGDPDYKTNDPWDFYPLLHSQDDHLFPFAP